MKSDAADGATIVPAVTSLTIARTVARGLIVAMMMSPYEYDSLIKILKLSSINKNDSSLPFKDCIPVAFARSIFSILVFT
jgi:hypothetical protein